MNIFFLHRLAPVAAAMHCDKHVGKMLIESCQLLATAHHVHGNGDQVSYKSTHVNHPSAIWTRQSKLHYDYVVTLATYLGREFFMRYGKNHKSRDVLIAELLKAPPALYNMPATWCNPPLAMPDEFKSNDAVESYRRYYASKAATMSLVYHRGDRPMPIWLSDLLNEQASSLQVAA
jgi:hypothetical protein